MKRATLLTILVLGFLKLALFGSPEITPLETQAVSIAIVSFQDDTGANATADLGQNLAQSLQQKIASGSKDLLPRLVGGVDSAAVKGLTLDQIAALAKQNGAKFVIRGGLLTVVSEPTGSDSKITVQLYADIISADNATILNTVRAEGSGTQTGAAPQLSSLDIKSDQFSSSGLGQAFAVAISQLADSIHQTLASGIVTGSTTGGNTQTTTTTQPDASQIDAAKNAESDTDLQQLITQAGMLLSSSTNPNGQSAIATSQALQSLKSSLESKAALMQNGKDTTQPDQDIATQRQALQTAVQQMTAEATAASSSGTVTTAAQQTSESKKSFIQTINDFSGQALSLLQSIQQMRTAIQSLTESSANQPTGQTGSGIGGGNSSPAEQKLGECSGVVTDQNGSAIQNAQVADQTSGISTSTDNNGQYDLKGLLANQTAVITVTSGGKSMTAQTTIVTGQTATLDFQFQADAGGINHPIVLPPTVILHPPLGSKVGALKGIVRDSEGRPLARALVTLKGFGFARTDSRGQFQFLNVPAGAHQLSFNQSGLQTRTTQVKVDAAKSTDAPIQFAASARIAPTARTSLIVTAAGGTFAGSVVDRQNLPVAGAKISLLQDASAVSVFTGPTGAFVLNNVKPGSYRIVASKAGYDSTLQNVTLRSGINTSVQFRLNQQGSAAVANLLKTLSKSPTLIRGRVLSANGSPIANATVALKPVASNKILMSIITNKNGEYQLNVDPGKYEVHASSNSYRDGSHTIEAKAGATAQSDFALEPRATGTVQNTGKKNPPITGQLTMVGNLVGQVTDATTGRPVASAIVLIAKQMQKQTDNAGLFTFPNLSPGIYQVTISKPGYSPVQASVSIQSGKTSRASLTLQPKSTKPIEIRRP